MTLKKKMLAALVAAGVLLLAAIITAWMAQPILTTLLALGACAAAVVIFASAQNAGEQTAAITHYYLERFKAEDEAAKPPATRDPDLAALAHRFKDALHHMHEHDRDRVASVVRAQQAARDAINGLPHAVAVLSVHGQIEIVNEAAERLFELHAGSAASTSPRKWLEPLVNKALESGHPAGDNEPAVQVFDNGEELFFQPRAIPMFNRQGKVMGVTVLLIDATQLRHVDEAKSGLLGRVSHELKTPLTSIQMSLHLLTDDPPQGLTAKQNELLKTACDDADRLDQLIQQTLDAGRRDAEKTL